MATLTESVKESLVGTTVEPQLSQQAWTTFDRNARKDVESGELYMSEDEFINAIAPANEDYVSPLCLAFYCIADMEYMANWSFPFSTR